MVSLCQETAWNFHSFLLYFLAQVPTANDVLMGIMETLGMEGNVQVRNETF